MKKRWVQIWKIFGPLVVAIALLFGLLVSPLKANFSDSDTLQRASVSLSNTVFKGQILKRQALAKNYVPFFGSSEWARMDLMHPSVLATKYHRSYRPFLLGAAGSQSLSHYFGMQDIQPQLKNKKAVVVLSPQWFTTEGQDSSAFSYYYSPLATTEWLLTAKNTVADRFAARRLNQMGTVSSESVMDSAVSRIAKGQTITTSQKKYLQIKQTMLLNEDKMFSSFHIINKTGEIRRGLKELPAEYSVTKLQELANEKGQAQTGNNRFQIDDKFYKSRLGHGKVRKLKDSQAGISYVKSPEYSDLQLMLTQFAKSNTNVLFVIPPVNSRWTEYTGLSQSMLQKTSTKIKQQLNDQGFNHVLDLSKDGNKKYFMQDTIHLGWNGWLRFDQSVRPFLENDQPKPDYHLNNKYFTKNWQNYDFSN